MKTNEYIIYMYEEEEGLLIKLKGNETHVRKLYMRVMQAVNEGLKLVDMYRVNDTIKKWSKGYFKQIMAKNMIELRMVDLINCHSEGKTKEISDYLMYKLEKRIQADPPEEN